MSILHPTLGIKNAGESDLSVISVAPTVRGLMTGWFRKLKLTKVIKTQVYFETKEVLRPLDTMGMVQPLTGRKLEMKPEGQRMWDWIQIHATPDLVLSPDDVIEYEGYRYRIESQQDWHEYGFVSYDAVNDYVKRR